MVTRRLHLYLILACAGLCSPIKITAALDALKSVGRFAGHGFLYGAAHDGASLLTTSFMTPRDVKRIPTIDPRPFIGSLAIGTTLLALCSTCRKPWTLTRMLSKASEIFLGLAGMHLAGPLIDKVIDNRLDIRRPLGFDMHLIAGYTLASAITDTLAKG